MVFFKRVVFQRVSFDRRPFRLSAVGHTLGSESLKLGDHGEFVVQRRAHLSIKCSDMFHMLQ